MTKAEAARIDRMLRLGCAACAELHLWNTAEVHHILEGNRRLGHWYTLPLCSGHHRNVYLPEQFEAIPAEKRVSIAHGRKEFVRQFPDERTLWLKVQKALKLSAAWPESKIARRS
jgi:hypothetical protein